jgi:hypothetical protein
VQSSAASATLLRLRYCVIRGASVYTIEKALTGHYRAEHLFALEQAVALYDEYQQKVATCDMRIEARSETAQFSSRSQGRGHKIAAATHDSAIERPCLRRPNGAVCSSWKARYPDPRPWTLRRAQAIGRVRRRPGCVA